MITTVYTCASLTTSPVLWYGSRGEWVPLYPWRNLYLPRAEIERREREEIFAALLDPFRDEYCPRCGSMHRKQERGKMSETADFYVCPQHVGTGGFESCCNCGGWEEGDPDYGRLCTEAVRQEGTGKKGN